MFDAILYIATTGCQWRMLPYDFPPVSTVRGYFYTWLDDGLLDEMNRKLVEAARLAEGRKAQPTAGVMDSQAIKTTEVEGLAGMMKINGSRGASVISSPTRSDYWWA